MCGLCRSRDAEEKTIMNKKEMIELMIQERLSLYFKKNGGPGKERVKRKSEKK